MGSQILSLLVEGDERIEEVEEYCHLNIDWEDENFEKLSDVFIDYKCSLSIDKVNLEKLDSILEGEGEFLISLIMNPMIDEYEEFTNLLMALIHLRDELNTRYKDNDMAEYEKAHVTEDMFKVYRFLILQWIDYMKHLREFYPALYIKEIMDSPFGRRTNEK